MRLVAKAPAKGSLSSVQPSSNQQPSPQPDLTLALLSARLAPASTQAIPTGVASRSTCPGTTSGRHGRSPSSGTSSPARTRSVGCAGCGCAEGMCSAARSRESSSEAHTLDVPSGPRKEQRRPRRAGHTESFRRQSSDGTWSRPWLRPESSRTDPARPLTIATQRSNTSPATKGGRDFATAEAKQRCCGRLSRPEPGAEVRRLGGVA